MSQDCRNNNLLQRNGTSRQQRLLKALLPDYVAVDERKIEDLKSFVKIYAKQIRFHDLHDTGTDFNWESFFDKKVDAGQQTEPHFALFLAFLQLFKIAQDDLNQITRKHLDFYYHDVLQLKEKAAVADQAFIIFELAKHVDQHLLKKGTQLKAGKDESGKELIYETNRDIVVNKATVEDIKAVFRDSDSRIYASPQAKSEDGLGGEISSAEMNWRTFGKPGSTWTPDKETDRPQAEIGFAFASPVLFLEEGDREITITLSLKETADNKLTELLKTLNLREAFRVRFSGEEKWIEPFIEENETPDADDVPPAVVERILNFLNSAESWEDIAGVEPQEGPVFDDPTKGFGDQIDDYDIGETTARKILIARDALGPSGFTTLGQVRAVYGVGVDKINDLIYTFRNPNNSTIVDAANKQIIIKRTITKDQDAIVTYIQNEETLPEPFTTKWPVVKITLRTDQDPYVYETLQKLVVKKAEISVHVSEVRELIIQNDQSVLDPGKDFYPFGIRPEIGSNFYVGNREVFSKQLEMLKINLLWHGLPDNPANFNDYYENYITSGRSNDSFKSNIYLLDKKNWIEIESGETADTAPSLFESDESGNLHHHRNISISNVEELKGIKRDNNLKEFDSYDTDSRKGFMRLELTETDFGHREYQPSYTKQVLEAFKDGTANPEIPMPNEPYTPLLKEIFMNYRSSVELDLNASLTEEEFNNRTEQFFHVEPFGVAEQKTVISEPGSKPKIPLFPQYTSEGSLYIGVRNFKAGRTLSLLFQVAEGSADPDLEPQPVKWSFLSDNEWVELDKFDIISDGTTGLLTSGIIHFEISKKATSQNTVLPSGLHWVRATVDEKSDAVSDLIEIMAQAVSATFTDRNNDPGHLKEALPAETIGKLKEADSAVSKILQPFASFGGKTKEHENTFYTRISERLRHKSRAVTIWDYERLVLEQFPSVYKAKCINHTRYTGSLTDYSEIAPGHVTLIVISNVRNKNAVDPLRPKTSLITLTRIHDYISGLNSECVDLHVKNPIYEEIKVKLNVRFYEGFDNGFYGKKLEDDLKSFLSPWAFGTEPELMLGGKIHKSVILNYVEERPYVDFVTCFEIYHIVKSPGTGDIISKTNVDEAVASTSVSILGSVGQAGQYGDHEINVLETDDCECDDNEIKLTAAIASADDCSCDEDQQFEI